MLGLIAFLFVSTITLVILKRFNLKEKISNQSIFYFLLILFILSLIISYFTYDLPLKIIYNTNDVYQIDFLLSFILYSFLSVNFFFVIHFIIKKYLFNKTIKKRIFILLSLNLVVLSFLWLISYDNFLETKDNYIIVNSLYSVGYLKKYKISDITDIKLKIYKHKFLYLCSFEIKFTDNYKIKTIWDYCNRKIIEAILRVSSNITLLYFEINETFHILNGSVNGVVFSCENFPCKVVLILNTSNNCYYLSKKFYRLNTIVLCLNNSNLTIPLKILEFLKYYNITNEKNMLIIGE